MSLSEMNKRNADFWAGQSRLRDQRMRSRPLAMAALQRIRGEEMRAVAIGSRVTLEGALEELDLFRQETLADARAEIDAEIRRNVLSESGRRGGAAPKRANPLQQLIHDLVARKPMITEKELLKEFERCSSVRDVIIEITEDDIRYELATLDIKTVQKSVLKDRLYRAKKRLAPSR